MPTKRNQPGPAVKTRTRRAATPTVERESGVGPVRHDVTLLSDEDLYWFAEGTHLRIYEKLGAHPITADGVAGTSFAVWAPNADYVAVIGDFNGWDKGAHPLRLRGHSGIWEGFVPGVGDGTVYKVHVASPHNGY